jgi:hypothetical protein
VEWIVGVLAAASLALPAHAQPTVTVKAESRLELDVRRTDDGLAIRGALRDDLGVALAREDVTLELSHADASAHQRGRHVLTRVVTAGADGTFATHFVVEPGDYVVEAVYGGAARYEGTRASRYFDLDRAHLTLRLTLDGGTQLDLSQPEHALTIVASSESGGAGLDMIVTDELGSAELGRGTTDDEGILHVTLHSAELGPPAAGRLVVRTRGDASRAEAQSELPVVRFRPTFATLVLSGGTLAPGSTIEASGMLTDGVGPLEREAISIVAEGRVVTTVLTGDDGRFVAALDEGAFVDLEGAVPLTARFDGSAPWVPGSTSSPQTLRLERPLAIGWLWAIVPIVIAAIIVRWSLRRDPAVRRPVVRRAEGAPGVALGQRRTIVAQRFEISGVVRDAITAEPVAGARVRSSAHEATTDSSGAFAFVAAREITSLTIEHAEYLPVEIALTLPHRGEHDGMQIRVANRRAVSFAALRQLAVTLAPDGEVALALTQREIFELLRSRGASPPALPDLVSRVEVACYADLPPTDAEIARIQQSAEALAVRPTARSAPPAPPEVTGRR